MNLKEGSLKTSGGREKSSAGEQDKLHILSISPICPFSQMCEEIIRDSYQPFQTRSNLSSYRSVHETLVCSHIWETCMFAKATLPLTLNASVDVDGISDVRLAHTRDRRKTGRARDREREGGRDRQLERGREVDTER